MQRNILPGAGVTFRFTPVSNELERLSDELQALGGGDARVASLEVVCRVRSSVHDVLSQNDVVFLEDNTILLRDLRASSDAPLSQSLRKFKVSRALGPTASQPDVYEAVGVPALNWILDGFNATILGYGQTGSGKTYSIFGRTGPASVVSEGIASRLISDLFRSLADSGKAPFFHVGISYWDLVDNNFVDLLQPPTSGRFEQRHAQQLTRSGPSYDDSSSVQRCRGNGCAERCTVTKSELDTWGGGR
mmetsp:Transcript_6554/g.10186  ORF Transcript_6554/g.10186 Transcript_6554/m.10186 type:complete len:247 (-) Transcript_6554:2804-3544(-)